MSKQFQKAKLYWNICKKPYNIEYRDGKIKVFPNLWSFLIIKSVENNGILWQKNKSYFMFFILLIWQNLW